MKKMLLATGCAAALAICATPCLAADFTLSSPDLPAGKTFPETHLLNGFGCKGGNLSPALVWKNAPKETKSFALTMYDPDAPTGSGFWHWVVINIPADAKELPRDAGNPASGKAPAGALQTRTDFGAPGWGGPCPPAGDKPHRYIFTLHALKTDKLDLPQDASAALVGFNIYGNTLAKTSFTAHYGR